MDVLKIIIDARLQLLKLYAGAQLLLESQVSTSALGMGCESGSYKTPTGLFRICEKIGDGNPAETVYRGRQPVNDTEPFGSDADLIMSRILWLDGREPQNANTKERFIYIHGTNQEQLVGSPASHGCIRMRNADMIELFRMVDVGTEVEIVS